MKGASNGHVEVVGLLLEAHATPYGEDRHGKTMLQQAKSNGYEGVVSLLKAAVEDASERAGTKGVSISHAGQATKASDALELDFD